MPRVVVEKLVYRGYGLARTDGKTMFIRRAAPGDVVEACTVESKKSFDVAVVETLVEPSVQRTDPPCMFFKQGCGGCQWQHLNYTAQLEWKEKIFREFLERNHFPRPFPPLQVIASPPFGYRTRFSFHLDDSGRPALFREQSHNLIPVDHCWLLPPPLNDLLSGLRDTDWLSGCNSFQIWIDDTGQLGLETSPPLSESRLQEIRLARPDLKLLHPLSDDRMEYYVGDFRFRVGAESFFQTNRFLNGALSETVCRLLGRGETLLDLYSGVGFFSIPLSSQFHRVWGVEENKTAAAQAAANAVTNRVNNAQFLTDKVDHCLETITEDFDSVLADPPRAGLSNKVTRWILEKMPQRIVYVSCDPTTLVRDIQRLSAAYQIQQFFLLDLFPQTFHFEVVAAIQPL